MQIDRLQIPRTTLGAYSQMAFNSPSKSRTTLTCTLALARAAHKTVLAEEQVARSRLEEAELLVQMLRAELDDTKLKVTQSESHVASVRDMLKEAGIPDSELVNTNEGGNDGRGRLPRDSGPLFPPETTTRSSERPVFPVQSTVQVPRSSPSISWGISLIPATERTGIHPVIPAFYPDSARHSPRSSRSYTTESIIIPPADVERSNPRYPTPSPPILVQSRPGPRSRSSSRSIQVPRSPVIVEYRSRSRSRSRSHSRRSCSPP